jgi:hypothetical protein
MFTLQDIGIIASIIIGGLGLTISIINLWYNFLWTPKPQFSCSNWLAVQETRNGQPYVSFAIQVTIINRGSKPVEIRDIRLVVHVPQLHTLFFKPVQLIDYADYKRTGSVGVTIPLRLPVVIPAKAEFDFGYPIEFLPFNDDSAGLKHTEGDVTLHLYAETDRYGRVKIATQSFGAEEMLKMWTAIYLPITASAIAKSRQEFLNNLINLEKSKFS